MIVLDVTGHALNDDRQLIVHASLSLMHQILEVSVTCHM